MTPIDKDALLDDAEKFYKAKEQEAAYTGSREICVRWDDAIYLIKEAKPVCIHECDTESTLDISLYEVKFKTHDADEYKLVQQFCHDVIDGNRFVRSNRKTLYLDDILEALTHELESYPDYAREANGVAHAMHVIERLAEVKNA